MSIVERYRALEVLISGPNSYLCQVFLQENLTAWRGDDDVAGAARRILPLCCHAREFERRLGGSGKSC